MAHYVDTHSDFTDCFVLRSATTGEWEARDRFNREDHHAHVQAGWEHHYTTAHIEPNNDIPF